MKVLILAGGFATRLWPLTEKRAKPLLEVGGKPLISHIIDKIPKEMEVIISTNQVFRRDFEALSSFHPDHNISVFIEDSANDKAKKGALFATSLVLQEYAVDEPLMLLAGDNFFEFSLRDFARAYEGKPLLAVYDTKSLEEAKQFGVVSVRGKKVIDFQEKPESPASTLVSTGCYIFPPEVFGEIISYAKDHSDNLGGIFEHLLSVCDVQAYPFTGEWIDIGSFQAYLDAHKKLYNTTRSHQPSLKNSSIGSCVHFGKHCEVYDSVVENSFVGKGCFIRNCHIRNSVIDDGCVLEGVDLDHKMIRSGSRIQG